MCSQNESQSPDWGSQRKGELSIVDQSDNFPLRSSWFCWTLLVMNWFWIQKWQNIRDVVLSALTVSKEALSFQLSPLFGLVPLNSSFLVAHLPLYRGQDEERVCWSSDLRGLEPFTLIPQPPPPPSSTLLCILTRMLPARPGEEELRLVLPVAQI